MNREELLKSTAYWTQMLQIDVLELVNSYLAENKMTRTQFAEKLGVSKGYISQILGGNFDHKISKLVELALACDYVPSLSFAPITEAEHVVSRSYKPNKQWTPIEYTLTSCFTKSLKLDSSFNRVKVINPDKFVA